VRRVGVAASFVEVTRREFWGNLGTFRAVGCSLGSGIRARKAVGRFRRASGEWTGHEPLPVPSLCGAFMMKDATVRPPHITVLSGVLIGVLFATGVSTLQAASEDLFVIGRLKYRGGGDWYSNPSSLPNLLEAVRDRTGIPTAGKDVAIEVLDEGLFRYPFLYMTGHGRVSFSTAEAARLERYLKAGGFLWADDNYGMDEYFRRGIREVLPEAELVELPFSHEIYHSTYSFPSGLPKIHEHHGGAPRGYGIFHEGRMLVFYSYNTDIGDGMEDPDVHNDPPEKREQAIRMGVNVVTYVLTH